MLIIGLTGSIGMGKTTAARRFASHGVPVFDADAEVHLLYEAEAAPLIGAAFPGTVAGGRVDRGLLAEAVLDDAEKLAKLEAIVHPLVRKSEREFLSRQRDQGADMAVLEIPLLFETGADRLVDVTIVVTAPREVQRQRVLQRPGMSEQKLASILAQQAPDAEKRDRADFVVETDGPVEATGEIIDRIIESLRGREGSAVDRWLEGEDAG
jgi:dephospho-CoA kinase